MSICPFCGENTMHRGTREIKYEYKGETALLNQPGDFCSSCDEGMLKPEDLKATRIELQTFHARVDGLLSPQKLRDIRKELKLNQTEAGKLFGGGKNAFSRYESGEVSPPKSISLLLSLLHNHKELLPEIMDKALLSK
ncbi:MAG: antitoxin [Oceanospirillaceae bacterium]|nr:antitoxin [Oceanospirillaceae bacterium]